jgi:hypothetical protein
LPQYETHGGGRLAAVADAAAADARAPVELLGEYLTVLADAAVSGRRPQKARLDLGRDHQVALAAPGDGIAKIDRAAVILERAVVDRFGDRDVLVATKDGRLVVLVPGGSPELRPGVPAKDVARVMQAKLNRHAKGARWQVAAGRPYPGTYGICPLLRGGPRSAHARATTPP